MTENLQHIKQVCDIEKAECEICGSELTCIGEENVFGSSVISSDRAAEAWSQTVRRAVGQPVAMV